MASTIKVYEGQSLLDICVQHCGSISALFEIMHLNNLEDLTLVPGTDLIIPDVINQQVVDYLANLGSSTQPTEYSTGGVANSAAEIAVKNSLNIVLDTGFFPAGLLSSILIADSVITINGDEFTTVPAADSLDIQLIDEFDNPITPVSIVGNEVKVPTPLPDDSVITVNGSAFQSLPANTDLDIILRDNLGNIITPTDLSSPVIEVTYPDPDVWVRPSDWLDIDSLVAVGDHKFVGLMAIWPDQPNVWLHSSSQAFTVRVDGVATNYAAASKARGQISYASVSDSTLTSEGFKQVIVEVYPQTAPWTGTFEITAPGTVNPRAYNQQYIDVRMSAPSLTNMFMNNGGRLSYLYRWVWLGTHNVMTRALAFHSKNLASISEDFTKTSSAAMFANTKLPAVLGDLTFTNATTAASAFSNTWGNKIIGNISLPIATSSPSFITNMFDTKTIGNISMPNVTTVTAISGLDIETIGTLDFSKVTSFTLSCPNLVSLGNITTGTFLTSLASAFSGNRLLSRVYISNCASVTNTASMLNVCHNLEELYLGGLTRGFTVAPCLMDDAAFAACFTSLGVASGAQTIVITGNITLSPATIAIATGKGFTLTP